MTTAAEPNIANIETITPDRANDLIESAAPNRRPNTGRIAAYADDMTAGRWLPAASMIALDPDGHLLDGMHRLAAVARCGIPQSFVVITVPAETQNIIDSGRPRRVHDQLQIAGVRNATSVAAAARTVIQYPFVTHTRTMTNSMVLEYIDEHPQIASFVQEVQHMRGSHTPKGWPSTAHMAALLFISPAGYRGRIMDAYDQIVSLDADCDQVRLYLRWLHRNAAEIGGGSAGTRMRWNALARIINAYLDGEEIRQLKVPREQTVRLAHERREFKIKEGR